MTKICTLKWMTKFSLQNAIILSQNISQKKENPTKNQLVTLTYLITNEVTLS